MTTDDWLEGPAGLDKAELAALLDVDEREVVRWIRQGCPSTGERKTRRFVVSEVVKWLLNQGDSLDQAKLRERAAIAEMRQLDLEQRRGDLIPADIISRQIAEHVAALQHDFMTLPARCNLPPDLAEKVRGELLLSINRFSKATDEL